MSIRDLSKNIDKLIKDLPSFVKNTAEDIALNDLAALISERVINDGVDERGNELDPYSTKTTLAGASTFTSKAAFNKIAGSKSKRRGLEWRTVGGNSLFLLKGGYKKVRELEGRETGHKSLERTGKMWQNFGIIKSGVSGDSYIVTLGGLNQDAQNKMNWNSEREGVNVVGATKEEEELVADLFEERFAKFINDNL